MNLGHHPVCFSPGNPGNKGIYDKGGAGENIANLIKYILERKKIWERYSPWEDMFNY